MKRLFAFIAHCTAVSSGLIIRRACFFHQSPSTLQETPSSSAAPPRRDFHIPQSAIRIPQSLVGFHIPQSAFRNPQSLVGLLIPQSLVATLLLCGPLIASAQKESHQRPSSLKVEFENNRILVLRIRLEPHEKTPIHQVTPRVVVWLTDAHLRDTFANGKTSELHRKSGTTEWVPAQEHAGENLGDQPIEFIAIVPKGAP
jgi:hypothetical protein